MFRLSPTLIMDKELRPSSSQNDITGDHMITKPSSKAYRAGYERIYGSNDTKEESLDAPQQSNQTCEDCNQQAEVIDQMCSG